MKENISRRLPLNDGTSMPQFGFGTAGLIQGRKPGEYFEDEKEQEKDLILYALQKGIRHLDCAYHYGSEDSVGLAIRESRISREEIFVTTKAWTDDLRASRVRKSLEQSLKTMGLDYVDMYMLHWPVGTTVNQLNWKILEDLKEEGLCRSIGVSNFEIHHLKEIMLFAKYMPACDEIECHPYYNRKDLLDFCKEYGIQVCACRPLGGTWSDAPRVNELLINMGKKYGKTNIQVILRWHIQRGTMPIPSAFKKEFLDSNCDIFDFELSEDEMAQINGLDVGRLAQDPDMYPF